MSTIMMPATRYLLPRQDATDVMPASQVKILIVDDQPANLLVLETVLEDLGHSLVRAQSGEEALKRLLQEDFAVILMDVVMPGMDGFETAELIRRRERSRYTPIVFLTALGTSENHVSRGYEVGAVDYLFKPIVPEILKAKVMAFVDLFLKSLTIAIQSAQLREFERLRHEAELAEAQRKLEAEKLEQDVRAARKVQQLLFPRTNPTCLGFEIAGTSHPSAAIGGDFFDYMCSSNGLLDVVIGDVSGHGFAAALLMSATRAYLRALSLARTRIDEILALANRALVEDMEGSHFVTLLYVRLRPGQLHLEYASAGHPEGYVLNSAGEVRATLNSTAIPLGITTDQEFLAGPQISLESGDSILLFTDGMTEAADPSGAQFGTEMVINEFRNYLSLPAAEIVERLHNAVREYSGKSVLSDDSTAIVIKVA
jgi:serine phosphatase RsbU (regulator of sigma subunit)